MAGRPKTLETVTLRIMCDDFDTEMVVELLAIFADGGIVQIESLRVATTQADWKRIELEAHSLASSSAALGGEVLSRLAANLEHSVALAGTTLDEVSAEVEFIACELERVVDAHSAFIRGLKSLSA